MSLKRFEVVPKRYWKNRVTGATASLYGAAPYHTDADKANWELVEDGLSLRDVRNNVVMNFDEEKMVRLHGPDWRNLTF